MRFETLSDSRFEYLCEVYAADKYETRDELIRDWKALGKKFPNGYLDSDLNPFENHTLCKHLRENFGYQLMGIGASYLALMRESALSHTQMVALAELLLKLYGEKAERWIKLIREQANESLHVLVLRYAE